MMPFAWEGGFQNSKRDVEFSNPWTLKPVGADPGTRKQLKIRFTSS